MKTKHTKPGDPAALRRRAEEKARAMESQDQKSLSPEEIRHLVHELRVHQIELEMQNEELRRTRGELEDRVQERTAELSASEERFRMMVEGVQDYAILMLDAQGNIRSWNAGAERIKGYRADEIIGRHFSSFYPPEDVASGQPGQTLVTAAARGHFEDEGWRVRKDGSRFFASVTITALRDNAGGLRGFAKITRDITERRKMEEEIERLNADLERRVRERTAELQIKNAVFDESMTANSIADAKGVINEANASFLRLWGYPGKAEVIGKSIASFIQKGADADRIIAVLGEVGKWEGDYTALRKDGSTFEAHGLATALHDENGGLIGYQSSVIDITARKKSERELEERTAALAAFNKAMIGREIRIIELKEEIDRLRAQPGKEPSPSIPSPLPAAGAAALSRQGFHWRSAGLVLVISLIVTGIAWFIARKEMINSARIRFDFRAASLETALGNRLTAYEYLLRGGAGLFGSSERVTRRQWRTYVEALRIDKSYPGIQGLGFSQRILPGEKEAHLRQIRGQGFPQYDIRPEGERPEYTAIIYLEPFDSRNQRAFGYDMFSEPVRREAMARARDSGAAAMSGKVTLVQETDTDVQAGFLMYAPVYCNGMSVETPEQRRAALEGYVYSPFRMNDFIKGILGKEPPGIEFEVFDGGQASKEALMYTSGTDGAFRERGRQPLFTGQKTIEFGGHQWLLRIASSPGFEATMGWKMIDAFLWLGILVSLLLFGIVLLFSRSYRQKIDLANASKDIAETNRKLSAEVKIRQQSEADLQRRVEEISASNKLMIDREQRIIEIKEEVNALCRQLGQDLKYPPIWRKGSGS